MRMMRVCLLLGALSMTTFGCGDDGGSGGAPGTTSSTSGVTTSASTTTPASTTTTASTSSSASSSTGGGLDCDPGVGTLEPIRLVPFVTGLDQPIAFIPHPTDPDRHFVASRTGVIRVVDGGVVLPQPFLDLSAQVSCCDEDRGFLGLAFAPDYDVSGLFYVHYTELGSPFDSTTVLAEHRRDPIDPDVASPTPIREIMRLDQNDVWHYGGAIGFGPDGMLYYPRGDGGGEGDPEDDAQAPGSRLGKILRIDPATFPAPPAGNMPGADPFVWSIGLRNPWRWSFDRCTGDLFLGDVGQNSYEEVSVAFAGEAHLDFGWRMFEGRSCFAPPCDETGIRMPVVELDHTDGYCAIIGGFVYRGGLLPGYRGRYFFGDICSRRISSLELDAMGAVASRIDHSTDLDSQSVLGDYTFASFGQDLAGEIYVVDLGGTIFRVEPD